MLEKYAWVFFTPVLMVFLCSQVFSQNTPEGTAWVDSHGYSKCIQLSNASTTVVLEPNCGGRVLEYTLNGQNAIYNDPRHDGWTYKPGQRGIDPCGGRFDIGPEMTIPRHNDLWLGSWKAEITGPRSARLTSVEDKATGVQLIRDFKLDKNSSHLKCTQTIKNISNTVKQYYHWGRTFAEGNGIFIVPLNTDSRFPKKYITFEPESFMNYYPGDQPNITVKDGFLVVSGPPKEPQLALDSYDEWFAYITRHNLLFVKKFPMYPDRVYSDMAATTIVIWYYKDMMCELEPMGPRETIKPGKSASYTEDWWLLPYEYPGDVNTIDCPGIRKLVEEKAR
ncbi:hypothetical protein LLG96_00335 [bacterium]|nr:hypothetical protein [bacterium]